MRNDDSGALPADLFAGTLALLEELTAISSPSGDAGGIERMAARLAAELAARGLEVEVRRGLGGGVAPRRLAPPLTLGGPTPPSTRPAPAAHLAPIASLAPDSLPPADPAVSALPVHGAPPATALEPPVLVARGPAAGDGSLLLIGHLDTVLPAAAPRRTGDRLTATGAIDMKGGLAVFLGALDLLRHRGSAPPTDLQLVVVPDEEVAGELSRVAVEVWGAAARALWVLEPGEPGSAPGAETVVGGRRGMFGWRLDARGRAAHSGVHFAAGRSALLAAARWCVEAAGAAMPREAPTINVGRLVAGDDSFVGDLAAAHGWLGTDRQLNVVPDRAVAEGEARFLRAAEGAATAERLERLAEEVGAATGTALAFTRGAAIAPVEPHAAQRAQCERAVALAAARGWRLEIEEQRGGISFPNFLPHPGRIPVLDGLGPIGGGMHTRDEYMDLASFGRRIVLLADLLEEDAAASARRA